MRTFRYYLVLIMYLFNINTLFAQLQLIDNFTEKNDVGDSQFGVSVASAGDVNGDGFNDIIVGAHEYYSTIEAGSAYLYLGGAAGIDSVADLIFRGEGSGDNFGYSVASAGDVNGDGFDDIIIGANGAYRYGKAYIYFGGTNMDTTADVILLGVESYPEYENGFYARSVASAGDINGDGYDDVMVGSPQYENNDINSDGDYIGCVHLYYGGANMDATRDLLFVGTKHNGKFGYSAASAGDINNDGYSDIIVGAYREGKAYCYLGGATPDTTADLVLSDVESFGFSVSSAGDVNNDNYDDIIVGNYDYTSAYIYYGGSSLDNSADVSLINTAIADFGYSVSTAGDVNNDGFDDVIVGAICDDYPNTLAGHAFIYLGGTNMDNVLDYSFSEGETTTSFGRSVSYAGDLNNDGYGDVIVGDNLTKLGSAFIFYGGQSMDNSVDVTLQGEGTNNFFGDGTFSGDFNGDNFPDIATSGAYGDGRIYIYYGGTNADTVADVIIDGVYGKAASAGDVNNDGFDDIIIANTNANNDAGEVYLYYGGNPMDTNHDLVIRGEQKSYQYFGNSLASAGDLNGDGCDDIIIGCYQGDYADIYFGGSPTMDAGIDLTLEDASVSYFGRKVSGAGDVNNDGFDDVMVNGSNYGYYNDLGRVLIYFGGPSMDNSADVGLSGHSGNDQFGYALSKAGDVNNDGYDDILVGAYKNNGGKAYIYYGGNPMNTAADITLDAELSGENFGKFVSDLGDINNDNYDDIFVSATSFRYNYSYYTVYIDKGYIYYGGINMDSTPDYTFLDKNPYNINTHGISASRIGDFNNDGVIDFAFNNIEHIANGMVFLYSDDSALPVELTTFNAKLSGNEVVLNWQTETEVNNYGFEIERQILNQVQNENKWEKIGFVKGHGNSNTPQKYHFNDDNITSGKIQYRLKQIDIDGAFEYSDIVEVNISNPKEFKLVQNYPNPFNPTTVIKYSIPEVNVGTRSSLNVQLKVYDVLGREVATLVDKNQKPGNYKVEFNAKSLTSGIYFYRLQSGNFAETKRLILLR